MGCDVCYTNHAEADQNDMDNLLTLLAVAGCTYIMGVPGADDVMLAYQSTSFHDALYLRRVLGLRPAPEFEAWLDRMGLFDGQNALTGAPSPRLWCHPVWRGRRAGMSDPWIHCAGLPRRASPWGGPGTPSHPGRAGFPAGPRPGQGRGAASLGPEAFAGQVRRSSARSP